MLGDEGTCFGVARVVVARDDEYGQLRRVFCALELAQPRLDNLLPRLQEPHEVLMRLIGPKIEDVAPGEVVCCTCPRHYLVCRRHKMAICRQWGDGDLLWRHIIVGQDIVFGTL